MSRRPGGQPGGGRQCAAEGCPKHLRRTIHGLPNPNVFCMKHNQLAKARRRRTEARNRSLAEWRRQHGDDARVRLPIALEARYREIFVLAWERAVSMGHDLELPRRDYADGGWISMCWGCGGYLVVDPAESNDAYGRCRESVCDHREWRPAVRRSMMDLDAAQATAAQEMADMMTWGAA